MHDIFRLRNCTHTFYSVRVLLRGAFLCFCITVEMICVKRSTRWYTPYANMVTHTHTPSHPLLWACENRVVKCTQHSFSVRRQMRACAHTHTHKQTHKEYFIRFMTAHKRKRVGSRRNKSDKPRHTTHKHTHKHSSTHATFPWPQTERAID